MTSTPFILCVADVESAAHCRTTFKAAAEAPIYFSLETMAQHRCAHPSVVNLDRFGNAECSACAAVAWSLRFLAMGVFGPRTVSWGEGEVENQHSLMQQQGVLVLDTQERRILEAMREEVVVDVLGPMPTPIAEPPSEIIAADLNPNAPERRAGVVVPMMARVAAGWIPDQPA